MRAGSACNHAARLSRPSTARPAHSDASVTLLSSATSGVTVRLRGPGQWLHNYRHGMVLRARLEPDGFWQALRQAPNLPGRWTHNNYLP